MYHIIASFSVYSMCIDWVHECSSIHKLHETHRQHLCNRIACMDAVYSALSSCFHLWEKKMSSLKQICVNILWVMLLSIWVSILYSLDNIFIDFTLIVKYLLRVEWIVLRLNWLSINEVFNTKLFSWFYRKSIRKRLLFPVQQRLWIIRLSGKFRKTYTCVMIKKIDISSHKFTIVFI